MTTPIVDFLKKYAKSDVSRLHMPGHKGVSALGVEAFDITEVSGADVLTKANGIIKQSQENASALFGTKKTLYSVGGSSQCIKAMLYLATVLRKPSALPIVVAARNVHQAFVYAFASLDAEPFWLQDAKGQDLCSCPITAELLEQTLKGFSAPVTAVYVTSPDYSGNLQPIEELAEVCHRYGTILLVDNAHGAYLRFLKKSLHPIDQGADLCCDSAHKTLPVLTGGAYLHIGKNAPDGFCQRAETTMEMFGSTSPSYLVLASLDLCNLELSSDFLDRVADTIKNVEQVKAKLRKKGWPVLISDPLRITVPTSQVGVLAKDVFQKLHQLGVECEYADNDYLVAMVSPNNRKEDLDKFVSAFDGFEFGNPKDVPLKCVLPERIMSIKQALFAECETVKAKDALGRICAIPTVSCPPAVPIVVSGEKISQETIKLLEHYGFEEVKVIKE